jgi:hypothetical protein
VATQALARQATQPAFGDVELTVVLRRVARVDLLGIHSCLLGREDQVERPFDVCVEVLAYGGHLYASGVACVEDLSHFDCPVDLSPTLWGDCLPGARRLFCEHKMLAVRLRSYS